MNFKFWNQSREGAIKENKLNRTALAIQTFVILVLAIGLANKQTTVVLVPPTFAEKSEVSASSASKQTKVMWGMYIAGLLGNITPTSAKALPELVSPHLSPKLWSTTREGLTKQIEEIQKEGLSLSFAPKIARMDPATGYVIVTGDLTIRGLRGQERTETRTYEMDFEVHNYAVTLDHLRVMQGKFAEEAAAKLASSKKGDA